MHMGSEFAAPGMPRYAHAASVARGVCRGGEVATGKRALRNSPPRPPRTRTSSPLHLPLPPSPGLGPLPHAREPEALRAGTHDERMVERPSCAAHHICPPRSHQTPPGVAAPPAPIPASSPPSNCPTAAVAAT